MLKNHDNNNLHLIAWIVKQKPLGRKTPLLSTQMFVGKFPPHKRQVKRQKLLPVLFGNFEGWVLPGFLTNQPSQQVHHYSYFRASDALIFAVL